jgi:hypothetical protein
MAIMPLSDNDIPVLPCGLVDSVYNVLEQRGMF